MTDRPDLTPDAVRRLIAVTDPWLSCDDCFDILDTVVEGVVARGVRMDPRFAVHLNACSVCCEEAGSLVSLIAPEHGLDPREAQRVLELAVQAGEH
jgi:hypothetical protein